MIRSAALTRRWPAVFGAARSAARSAVRALIQPGVIIVALLLQLCAPGLPVSHAQSTTITLDSSSALIQGCETIQVKIRINNVADLYGADVRLSFDPDVLEVVDADLGLDGIQLQNGGLLVPPLYYALNAADNTAGTIQYAITQLNPTLEVSGSGILAIIRLRAKSTGVSALHFTYSKLATRNGAALPATPVDGNVSTTAPTSPTLSIARLDSATARLSWTAAGGVAEYRLYRDTVPYFTPGDTPYQTTTGLSYDDVGVLSDTSTNYYYTVKSRCADGYQSAAAWQVGKFVLKVLPGYNHVSNPLVPSSANINDVIGTQLTGGPDVTLGDRVLIWDQAQQNYGTIAVLVAGTGLPAYEGKWLDELSWPNLSAAQLGAGQAFWIQNRHGTQYVSLVGRVPYVAEQHFTFGGGAYAAFGTAYLLPFGLADSNLYESGASGGTDVTLGDRILQWNAATQTYDGLAVLIDGTGDPTYDGKWLDELNFPNESAMLITPGLGYFFANQAPSGFGWSYPK